MNFEADGVATFQGTKIGVIKQIISKHAPYCIGLYCMVYSANLAYKTLSSLDVVARVKELLQNIHLRKKNCNDTKSQHQRSSN